MILISVMSMVGLGVFFAVVLAIADKTMAVKEDTKTAAIEALLPGLNCGACGYAGCQSFAAALGRGDASVTGCLAGGDETAARLAELLGVQKAQRLKSVAVLRCNADFDRRKRLADYKGIETCLAANRISGGGIACNYGCLGYGDCARACPFGAIKMANGLPVVDASTCTACGKCTSACPRELFSIEKFRDGEVIAVACKSTDSGARVKTVCGVGCIGCKLCEKLSGGAFEVKDNLAGIDYNKATPDTNWNETIEKCPTKVIVKIT